MFNNFSQILAKGKELVYSDLSAQIKDAISAIDNAVTSADGVVDGYARQYVMVQELGVNTDGVVVDHTDDGRVTAAKIAYNQRAIKVNAARTNAQAKLDLLSATKVQGSLKAAVLRYTPYPLPAPVLTSAKTVGSVPPMLFASQALTESEIEACQLTLDAQTAIRDAIPSNQYPVDLDRSIHVTMQQNVYVSQTNLYMGYACTSFRGMWWAGGIDSDHINRIYIVVQETQLNAVSAIDTMMAGKLPLRVYSIFIPTALTLNELKSRVHISIGLATSGVSGIQGVYDSSLTLTLRSGTGSDTMNQIDIAAVMPSIGVAVTTNGNVARYTATHEEADWKSSIAYAWVSVLDKGGQTLKDLTSGAALDFKGESIACDQLKLSYLAALDAFDVATSQDILAILSTSDASRGSLQRKFNSQQPLAVTVLNASSLSTSLDSWQDGSKKMLTQDIISTPNGAFLEPSMKIAGIENFTFSVTSADAETDVSIDGSAIAKLIKPAGYDDYLDAIAAAMFS